MWNHVQGIPKHVISTKTGGQKFFLFQYFLLMKIIEESKKERKYSKYLHYHKKWYGKFYKSNFIKVKLPSEGKQNMK